MRVVMTLRTRDQADLVDALVSFHVNAGVDFVIATDHRSQDGTAEILEAYAAEGCLHLIREEGDEVRGSEWRTRMARMAATEYGADWVINADGDEFWWPRGASLKEVLDAIPDRYGALFGFVRNFLARPEDGRFFAERMAIRLTPQAPINDPIVPHRRPFTKVLHRAHSTAVVDTGAHRLVKPRLEVLRTWHPVEVLHFPVRSAAQLEQRHQAWWVEFQRRGRLGDVRAQEAFQRGAVADYYASLAVDEDELERGLADGSFALDTRLRDTLRTLRRAENSDGRAFSLPSELERPLALPSAGVAGTVSSAVEVDVRAEAELVRLQRRLDSLERRLTLIDGRQAPRLAAGVRAGRAGA